LNAKWKIPKAHGQCKFFKTKNYVKILQKTIYISYKSLHNRIKPLKIHKILYKYQKIKHHIVSFKSKRNPKRGRPSSFSRIYFSSFSPPNQGQLTIDRRRQKSENRRIVSVFFHSMNAICFLCNWLWFLIWMWERL
jgi:hypothetical protein